MTSLDVEDPHVERGQTARAELGEAVEGVTRRMGTENLHDAPEVDSVRSCHARAPSNLVRTDPVTESPDSFPPSALQIETLTSDNDLTVVLRGDVDASTAPQFEAVVSQALDEGTTRIELDLDELGFLDSTGVSVIALIVRRLRAVGNRLTILNCPPPVEHLLTITSIAPHVDFGSRPAPG